MAKQKKYNYPKGYIDKKTGRAKRGFMPTKKGAQIYVKGNVDNIKAGNIPYESLTKQEKAIYRSLVSPVRQNTFYYKGKQLYDPTGYLRQVIDSFPNLRGKNNLNNLISNDFYKKNIAQPILPGDKIDLFNISQKFIKGKKKKINYITKDGTNLDVVSRLNRLLGKGWKIDVNGLKGKQAIQELKDFEAWQIDKKLEDSGKKSGHIQIFYKNIEFNPTDKSIKIKADEESTKVTDFTDSP